MSNDELNIIYNTNNIVKDIRIDSFLASELKNKFSRNDIQHLIKHNFVKINGVICNKNSFIIKNNDKINVNLATVLNDKKEVDNTIISSNIKIVFENDNLFIVNKPRGLTTHPGAGNSNNTLMNILLQMGKKLATYRGDDRMGIVHRLDKDTSGLLIIAKHNRAHQLLCEMIAKKNINRRYLAICHGTPMPHNNTIHTYIERDKKNIEKMSIIKLNEQNIQHNNANNVKEAITHYRVLKILDNGKFSLIECKLDTGRTHQIRAHMQFIKHPIVGDKLYSNNKFQHYTTSFQIPKHQLLHAYKLNFVDPISQEEIALEKNCEEIEEIVKKLK